MKTLVETLCLAAVLALAPFAFASDASSPNLGRPLTPDEIRNMDITVFPDGRGLPAGSGTVSAGEAIYMEKCQSCHGPQGTGGPMDRLTGGIGSLATPKPVKTATRYWPSATTIFDYVRRAMPLNAPESLSNDEVYAVTAYLLSIDGILSKNGTLDAKSMPRVKMPNQDGFVRYWPLPKK